MVDRVVAIVNNEVILNSELDQFYKTLQLRKELDPLFGFNQELTSGAPKRDDILKSLTHEKLIAQQFKITDVEVDQEIQSVLKNNNLSQDSLNQFLKSKGFDFNQYYELMRMGLQKRNLLDREIRTRVNISDDDIKNYFYNQAIGNSSVPLEYSIQMITINSKSYRKLDAAEKTAKDALKSIQRGESFEEVAKRVSDDASASDGGTVGFISSDHLSEPLRGSIKKMQIGQVSDVIHGSDGFFIVKLLEVRSTESQKLAEMKETIREMLAKEEYKKQLMLWSERAENNAYIHINK